ncbi:hypothetical protein K439DRAFT_1626939 [Ramaria rubella]|nr:hypothetical protein K439DRAFT_1626939 [Ramaria rubella]
MVTLWLSDTSMLGKWLELLEDPMLSLGKHKSSVVSDASSDTVGLVTLQLRGVVIRR